MKMFKFYYRKAGFYFLVYAGDLALENCDEAARMCIYLRNQNKKNCFYDYFYIEEAEQ